MRQIRMESADWKRVLEVVAETRPVLAGILAQRILAERRTCATIRTPGVADLIVAVAVSLGVDYRQEWLEAEPD